MRARAGCACFRLDRRRPSVGSRTQVWMICSKAFSTMCCLRFRRPGGGRSRSHSCRGSGRATPWIRGRSRSRRAARSHLLGERGPILVAIDDVQWLDRLVGGALAFALRRLGESRCSAARSARVADGAPPSAIEQALGAESVRRLDVEPLSVGALHRLLRSRLGRPFARQTLLRIHERSGGNPFFALELARVLDRGPRPGPAARRSRDARGAPAREDLRASGADTRGARPRRRRSAPLRSPCCERAGVVRGGTRPGRRRACGRARRRDDSLHPPAAFVGPLRRPRRGPAEVHGRIAHVRR